MNGTKNALYTRFPASLMTPANKIPERISTDVCVVGGGPAGLLLGLLLAKKNVRVLILEQHQDFDREYRGELLMPRFSQLYRQLGLLDYILQFPHTKLKSLEMFNCNRLVGQVPLSEIDPFMPYTIWMAQPVLLEALSQKASHFSNFQILFGVSFQELLRQKNRTTYGLLAKTPHGILEVHAKVVVGADGRHSQIRRAGGFSFENRHHDFDVLWFSLERPSNYGNAFRLYYTPERSYVVSPKYPDLLQCGLLAKPGEFPAKESERLDHLRQTLLNGPPFLHSFAHELHDIRQFFRLQAVSAFVKNWAQPGLLLIGDAAHTSLPVGAVGVALASMTAAVAADAIIDTLHEKNDAFDELHRVQKLCAPEIRKIQRLQRLFSSTVLAQSNFMKWLLPRTASWIAWTGLPQRLHKRMIFAGKPFPIRS